MVKTLYDCCLQCVANNLRALNRPGSYLTRTQKEDLLERMCWHELFTIENLRAISYNLLSDELNRIHMSYSEQVNDELLKLLSSCKCSPKWLTIHKCKAVTSKGLVHITGMLSQVETLQLRKLPGLIDSVTVCFNVGELLTHLDLRECEAVTDVGLMALLKRCPNISILNVAYLSQLTNKSLQTAASCLGKNLLELDAAKVYHITNVATEAIADNCPNLTMANFDDCLKLDGLGICKMARQCNLKVLQISYCFGIKSQALGQILQSDRLQENLVELVLFRLIFDPSVATHLEMFSSLSELSLCGMIYRTSVVAMNLPIEVIDAIVTNCHNLETLMLAYCKEVDDTVVLSIAKHCPKLKRLSLRRCKVTDSSVCEVAIHCHDLLLLELARIHKLTDKCVIALAGNCPYLEELYISGCTMITSAATRYLQDCSVRKIFILHSAANLPPNAIMAKDLDTGEYTCMDNSNYTTFV
ncbi:F-box/LRR-repeat protein 20-like isoform X4 [Dysidea avara]|uniref:F-box/LRR-repeat protein 20-like isoform X4 n=1 Tax=Dysidea avara TaxID=196820 RepID=UPI00331DA66B